jgi:hypothetical protein
MKVYMNSFLCLICFCSVFFTTQLYAIVSVGSELEFEGFVKFQNILRTPRFKNAEAIMQRNTAQLEGKYYFLKDSKAFGLFNTGPIEEASLTVTGRGVYDSIYDVRNSYDEAFGKADGRYGRTEASLREAFVDVVLPPVTLRLGRQQVVWGETDAFRALDVINPLDLSWHWSRESWEDIRIPLWMARGIYDIGKFSWFDESFIEAIWIPTDFRENNISTDPRKPWAFTGDGLNKTANSIVRDGSLFDLDVEMRNRRPNKKLTNGQAGVRFKAIWGEVDFSLNYFYGFSADTGIRVQSDLSRTVDNTFYVIKDIVNPRTHVLGFTANYSDERFTQSVLRMETTFTTGVPVKVAENGPLAADQDRDQYDTARRTVVMIGADRPTWIKSLNKTRTIFLSSQIFWRHYIDYNKSYRGMSTVRQANVDGLAVSGKYFSVNTDQIDRDEFVMTFSASTAYGAAGLLKPSFSMAFDPRSTGAYNNFKVDYFWSDNILLRFQQHIYWRAFNNDPGPWGLGDIWGQTSENSRHETDLSIIFQF